MKSVLISIKPKWCELIANGKKTIELRKTSPKLETPFKCYIYCTKPNERLIEIIKDGDENYGEIYHGKPIFIKTTEGSVCDMYGKRQKVIGEFVCDNIECVDIPYPAFQAELDKRYIEQSCCSYWQLHRYFYHDNAYFWHISDLVIYDKPRELSEFRRWVDRSKGQIYREDMLFLQRPPQSWCYVEECEIL